MSIINTNGSKISINGLNIKSLKDLNLAIEYNTKNILSKLIAKTKKVTKALAISQMTIGESSSFGFTGELEVKFNKKRAGNTVKFYRYNEVFSSIF